MVASDDNKTRDLTWSPFKVANPTTSPRLNISTPDCKSDKNFSINWSKWKLCGREAEIKQLEECYLTRKEQGLVLVTGPLGIGKTVLTDCLQRRVREDAGILVRGSFHTSQTEPYMAFVEAFKDLVNQLRLKNDYEIIRSDIRKAIAQSGAEWFLVSDGLAILKTLMQDDDDDDDSRGLRAPPDSMVLRNDSERQQQLQQQAENRQQSITAFERENRFVKAVTKVVEAIGTVFPLVIVIDNLMWADLGSLLLLESLCVTGNLSNVLLVLTCRGEEVGLHDPLSVKLRSLEDRGIALTDVRVPPLSVDDTFELLLALADRCLDDLPFQQQLANNIHTCTDGVPLLICELLVVLEKEGLQSILLKEHLSYDDFITAKIWQAQSSRHALQLMACIGGGTIHGSVLCELLHETVDETKKNLVAAQDQGLITVSSDGTGYAFTNGNIQSFVYNSISATDRKTSHYNIATKLHDWLSEEQIQDNIFLLVDQYIHANDLIPPNKKEAVARLCLIAAQKAAACAAFSSAEIYVRFGLSLFDPRTKWRDSYGLTLALMNATIELEFCHGNHEKVDALHEEILSHSRTPVDAIDSYAIHLSSLGSRGKTNEAVIDALEALASMGEKIPRRYLGLRIVAGRFRIKKIMKENTDQEMLSLPLLTNSRIAAILKIMHLMFVYVYMKQSSLTPIIAMRCIDLTCRYGLHPMSATSLAVFGMVEMMAFQDYEEGYRCGKLALKLFDILQCPELTSRTYSCVHGFLMSYREPLRDALRPLDDAYRLNILTGDVELSVTCKSMCLGHSFLAGVPLFQVISGFRQLIEICKDHNQRWVEQISRLTSQMALNLSGYSPLNDPFELTGEFMTEETVEAAILADKNEVQLSWLYFLKYMMAVYLCDPTISLEAESLTKPLKKLLSHAGFYVCRQQSFHEGMLSCHLASATSVRKRRKLMARALCCLTTMQKFSSVCPANFQNKAILLEAEIESVKGSRSCMDITLLYEEAARLACKGGFLHEQALALEKGGYHIWKYLGSGGDCLLGRSFLLRAIDVYDAYGSRLKVEQLRNILSSRMADAE